MYTAKLLLQNFLGYLALSFLFELFHSLFLAEDLLVFILRSKLYFVAFILFDRVLLTRFFYSLLLSQLLFFLGFKEAGFTTSILSSLLVERFAIFQGRLKLFFAKVKFFIDFLIGFG